MKSSVDENQMNFFVILFPSFYFFLLISEEIFDGRYDVRGCTHAGFSLHVHIHITLLTTFCLRHSADYIDNHNVIIISLFFKDFSYVCIGSEIEFAPKMEEEKETTYIIMYTQWFL